MAGPPLVSIIIPTYNRAHLLGETLDSLLAQTYTNWECIVVDDGSMDATEALLHSYMEKDKRFQYHKRPDTHLPGGNGARNYGFEQSAGEYVVFFDSDDIFLSTCLEQRMQDVKSSACDLLINNSGVFKAEVGDMDMLWNSPLDPTTDVDALIQRFFNLDMPWQTGGATWKRTFLMAGPRWNESLKAWQDWEFHIKALFCLPRICISSESPDTYYRYFETKGIASGHRTRVYYFSIKKALDSIYKKLSVKAIVKSDLLSAFKKLAYVMLIKHPVKYVDKFLPLKFLFSSSFYSLLSRRDFIKVYIIELLGKNKKVRGLLIQRLYEAQEKRLLLNTRHLKNN